MPNAKIKIKMFGNFEIVVNGNVALTQLRQAKKTSQFLEYLILKKDRAVPHEELLEMLNRYNKKYKTCKYYLDDEENLVLDTCILCGEEKIDGDLVYAMFRVLLHELEDHYPELMKIVWE